VRYPRGGSPTSSAKRAAKAERESPTCSAICATVHGSSGRWCIRPSAVIGNVVAVELTFQGTFTKPFESPAGIIKPTGAKLDVPGGDFWYVENGKIKEFNCYVSVNVMLEQMGVRPNFAAAVNAP
jgi:hypothetical protein